MNKAQLELASAFGIVVVLIGMAGFFAWRQWRAWQAMPRHSDLPLADRLYLTHQVWRRLAGCVLMVLLALMLGGWYVFDFDGQAAALTVRGNSADTVAEAMQRGAAQQRFINFFSFYWIFTVLVLLGIVFIVALDVIAIRRFSMRHMRQIQSERRAMIEREVALMRSQRNGHN